MSKLGKEGHRCHFEILLNEENAKIWNSASSSSFKPRQNMKIKGKGPVARKWRFFFRESKTSL